MRSRSPSSGTPGATREPLSGSHARLLRSLQQRFASAIAQGTKDP